MPLVVSVVNSICLKPWSLWKAILKSFENIPNLRTQWDLRRGTGHHSPLAWVPLTSLTRNQRGPWLISDISHWYNAFPNNFYVSNHISNLRGTPFTSSRSVIISQVRQIQCYYLWDPCLHCSLPFCSQSPRALLEGEPSIPVWTHAVQFQQGPCSCSATFYLSHTFRGTPHRGCSRPSTFSSNYKFQSPCFYFPKIHIRYFRQMNCPFCNKSVISFSLLALYSGHPVPFMGKQSMISYLSFPRDFYDSTSKNTEKGATSTGC